MIETPRRFDVGELLAKTDHSRPQPPLSLDTQLKALPPAVRSVAESLLLRDLEGAKRYVSQYLSANRGVRS